MIVRRRTWMYRMAGQRFVHSISFKCAVTALQVKAALKRFGGVPQEIWGRSSNDLR